MSRSRSHCIDDVSFCCYLNERIRNPGRGFVKIKIDVDAEIAVPDYEGGALGVWSSWTMCARTRAATRTQRARHVGAQGVARENARTDGGPSEATPPLQVSSSSPLNLILGSRFLI